jgi:FKBP-type peptidyl-prolyl cis-trans isomerase FkpA
MRLILLLAPAVLLAQTAPAPKAPAKAPATGQSAAPKPAGTGTTAARPAAKAAPKTAPKPAGPPPLTTDEQKEIYALGLSLYRSLGQFDLSPAELEIVKRALSDAAAKKPAVELDQWGPKIQSLATARAARVTEREKAASAAYLAKAAAESGAVKTDSGMIYKEVRPGTGESPKATDTVKVNYRGTLVNGTEFDSSYKRNEPAQFSLNGVIRCWTEGVQKMKTGGKSILVCPSDLAYGDQGRPGIPGGATLVFEIELLEIGVAK